MNRVVNAERIRRDVVVIGASAGGVVALRDLLAALPADIPAAIAVVLHRSPGVESRLSSVLGLRASIPVIEATDGAPFRAGHAYVAPRDQHMHLEGPTVRLSRGPKERYTRPAIDPLFRSAAESFGRRVVGVVLSGSGDDGVNGLLSISSAGGISIVQDPAEAAFPQMPRSALANRRVQAALPLGEIPGVLALVARGERSAAEVRAA